MAEDAAMADDDLYSDFAAPLAGQKAPSAPSDPVERPFNADDGAGALSKQQDEPQGSPAHQQDDTPEPRQEMPEAKVDNGDLLENISIEESFKQISLTLQLHENTEPGKVLQVVKQRSAQMEQLRQQMQDQQRQSLSYHVRAADMAVEVLALKKRLQETEADAQPEVARLRTLHCDAAVARQFSLMRDENKRLHDEKQKLVDELQGLQFKVGDSKGRQLVAKLRSVQDENKALEEALQAHDETLTQLSLCRQQLADVTLAWSDTQGEVSALNAQVEDFAAAASSLLKSDGRHGAFQLQTYTQAHRNDMGHRDGRDMRPRDDRMHHGNAHGFMPPRGFVDRERDRGHDGDAMRRVPRSRDGGVLDDSIRRPYGDYGHAGRRMVGGRGAWEDRGPPVRRHRSDY